MRVTNNRVLEWMGGPPIVVRRVGGRATKSCVRGSITVVYEDGWKYYQESTMRVGGEDAVLG